MPTITSYHHLADFMCFYITMIKINMNFQGLTSHKKEKEITPLVSGEMILRGKIYIIHTSLLTAGEKKKAAMD